MCGLYGVLSYGNKVKDMAEITEALAVESAVRGTDATGIAYNKNGKLTVFKKSKSAYEMSFSGPKNTAAAVSYTHLDVYKRQILGSILLYTSNS